MLVQNESFLGVSTQEVNSHVADNFLKTLSDRSNNLTLVDIVVEDVEADVCVTDRRTVSDMLKCLH